MGTEKPRRIRWWPAALIVALVAAALCWVWLSDLDHRQNQVLASILVAVVGLLLLLVWLAFFSALRWRSRLAALASVFALFGLAGASLRVGGVSGDVMPILEWRWSGAPMPLVDETVRGERAATQARDYPRFLGPRGDATLYGVGLDPDWQARPPREVWRRPLGAGYGAFAVADGLAVTQEQAGDEELVTCYELASGNPVWRHSDPARFEEPISGTGPRATPAIHEGRVFTLGATGILNVLELASGKRIWSRQIATENQARVPTYGYAGSPLIVDDNVVVLAGGPGGRSLVAYDVQSGEPRWSGGDDPAAYGTPVYVEQLAGRRQLLIRNDRRVLGQDPESGEVLWDFPWPGGTENASQPLALPGDRLFISSGYGVGGKLLRIEASGGMLRAELVWESRSLKAKFTNVVHREGFLYGLDDGILVSLDLADGSRRWKRGRFGHGQVMLLDELLLVAAENGDAALVEARPDEFRELGRVAALDGKTWNHPALAVPYLLMRNDREAVCLELPLR